MLHVLTQLMVKTSHQPTHKHVGVVRTSHTHMETKYALQIPVHIHSFSIASRVGKRDIRTAARRRRKLEEQTTGKRSQNRRRETNSGKEERILKQQHQDGLKNLGYYITYYNISINFYRCLAWLP